MTKEVKMPFLKHIEEFRKRVLYALVAVIICFIPSYYFSELIFEFLMKPLIESLPEGSTLIFTRPAEGFTTYLKIAFFCFTGTFSTGDFIPSLEICSACAL